jgi:hypothetical protein
MGKVTHKEKPTDRGSFQRQLDTLKGEKYEFEALLNQRAGRPVVINRPTCA